MLSDEEKLQISQDIDLISIEDNIENSKFENQELEIEEINALYKTSDLIQLNRNSNLKYECKNNLNNTDELAKLIKKTKTNDITLLWNNGFKSYIFSTESINAYLNDKKKKNKTNDLITHVFSPNSTHRDLRPDESHYYIGFDSVGIFPSYQIEIYWKFNNGKDLYGETIYDSLLFIKECIQFSEINEFKGNKKNYNLAMFSEYDTKCKIAINQDYIANLCYQSQNKVMTDEIIDKECTPCRFDCLYRKKFSLVLKGCAPGIKEDRIPDGFINTSYFLFQCILK